MKTILTTLAVCTGLASLPAAALALATPAPAMSATWMCRQAMANEKPTAMMGSTGIVCKPTPKMDPMKMGPDTTGMSKADADAAWRNWLQVQMQIPMFGGG
jgi:hypothetical protein